MKAEPIVSVVATVAAAPELRFDPVVPEGTGIMTRFHRWYCRFTASDVATLARRDAGIHAYVGLNGGGKTACMVNDIRAELAGMEWHCDIEDHAHCDPQYDELGEFVGYGEKAAFSGFVRVLSTVRLLDPETGQLHERYEKFSNWHQLDHLEHAVLVLDEISGVAHSRDSGSLPHDIMNRLMQLRKGDVRVLWSAPHWARADKLIREVTSAITVCVGLSPLRVKGSLWRMNQRFLYRTFETRDFDEWTAGRVDKLEPLAKEYVWGVGSEAFKLYNTRQKVTRIGHANDAGVCVECGGTRRRRECQCDDYQASKGGAGRQLGAPPRPRAIRPYVHP